MEAYTIKRIVPAWKTYRWCDGTWIHIRFRAETVRCLAQTAFYILWHLWTPDVKGKHPNHPGFGYRDYGFLHRWLGWGHTRYIPANPWILWWNEANSFYFDASPYAGKSNLWWISKRGKNYQPFTMEPLRWGIHCIQTSENGCQPNVWSEHKGFARGVQHGSNIKSNPTHFSKQTFSGDRHVFLFYSVGNAKIL